MSKYSLKEYYRKLLKEDSIVYDDNVDIGTIEIPDNFKTIGLKKSADNDYIENKMPNFTLQEIEKLINEIREDIQSSLDDITVSLDIPGEGEFFKGIRRDVKFDNFLALLFIAKEDPDFPLDFAQIIEIINQSNIENVSSSEYSLAASRYIKGKVLSESNGITVNTAIKGLLTQAQRESIETKVVDSNTFLNFKENFINYMIMSCSLDTTPNAKDLFKKSPPEHTERTNFIDDLKANFSAATFKQYLILMTTNQATKSYYNSFFTYQGTTIGCLFEDIFSKEYNSWANKPLNTKPNRKKVVALLFCEALLGNLQATNFMSRFPHAQGTISQHNYVHDFATLCLNV